MQSKHLLCCLGAALDDNHRFAMVVLPVYEDPADQEEAPSNLQNTSPFSWSWLSTVNRVNSQVQKVSFKTTDSNQFRDVHTSNTDTRFGLCHDSISNACRPGFSRVPRVLY